MTRKVVSNTRSIDVFWRIFLPLFFRGCRQRRMSAVSRIKLKFYMICSTKCALLSEPLQISIIGLQKWILKFVHRSCWRDTMSTFSVLQESEGEWTSDKIVEILRLRIPAYFVPDPQLLHDVITAFQTRLEDVFVVSYPKSDELCLLTTFFLYLS